MVFLLGNSLVLYHLFSSSSEGKSKVTNVSERLNFDASSSSIEHRFETN